MSQHILRYEWIHTDLRAHSVFKKKAKIKTNSFTSHQSFVDIRGLKPSSFKKLDNALLATCFAVAVHKVETSEIKYFNSMTMKH